MKKTVTGKRQQSRRVWNATVSLEYDLEPVLTWRGVVQGASVSTAARRGLLETRKAYPGSKPRSYVVALEPQMGDVFAKDPSRP